MSVTSPSSISTRVSPTRGSLLSVYSELAKARLSSLVLLTTAAGFILASPASINWMLLLWTVLGTAMAAASASAFNQLMEVQRDRLMPRTRSRPLPSGAIGAKHAFAFAVTLGYAGICLLALLVSLPAAGLALLTILLYVLTYTPLKSRTTLNTLVGAVCGAIPPLIGWIAAAGSLSTGALLLATLLFVWQLPHFLALAWMYRDDYAAGGFRMLPNLDESGTITGQASVLTSLLLLPIGLMCLLNGMAGWFFAAGATIMGMLFLIRSIQFAADRQGDTARRLFHMSVFYLCSVLVLLVLNRGPAAGLNLGPVDPATAAQAAPLRPVLVPAQRPETGQSLTIASAKRP